MPRKELFEVFSRTNVPINDGKHPGSQNKPEEKQEEPPKVNATVTEPGANSPAGSAVSTPEPVAAPEPEAVPSPTAPEPVTPPTAPAVTASAAPAPASTSSHEDSEEASENKLLQVRYDTAVLMGILMLGLLIAAYLLGDRVGRHDVANQNNAGIPTVDVNTLQTTRDTQVPPAQPERVTVPPSQPVADKPTPPASTGLAKGDYTMQIVTYRNTKNDAAIAKKLQASLKNLGLVSFSKRTSKHIIVYVGKYKAKTDPALLKDKGTLARITIKGKRPFAKPLVKKY